MQDSHVLITGATGYIGFKVLLKALKAGYRARCAVRSQQKADVLLQNPALKKLDPREKLSFVIVPDISAPGAYEEAVDGISYILHVASPVPGPNITDYVRDLTTPAVRASMEILLAASKTPSVKRIVFTSSVCATAAWETLAKGDASGRVYTARDRIPVPSENYANQSQAYNASKVLALKAIEEYMQHERPSFDVIHVMPGWAIGRNDLATSVAGTLSGTNAAIMGHILGHTSTKALSPICGHVDDVAKAHILALDPKVAGGQSFGACLRTPWNDALDIVRQRAPEYVANGVLPANGSQPSVELQFDSSDTERALGFKLQGFDEQVMSAVNHYLEELAKPGAKSVQGYWDGDECFAT